MSYSVLTSCVNFFMSKNCYLIPVLDKKKTDIYGPLVYNTILLYSYCPVNQSFVLFLTICAICF